MQLCAMISPGWFIFLLIVLVLAYLSASYHYKEGYPFWRTFILASMGFFGLGLMLFQLFLA